ncbi:hypothetical protein F5148DRAFT_981447 [Russula earlei]|uniref:Uncharacterized protein n=1 Tax=Russula earlei TaxID=71964 RepID=A0ACC0U8M7_9AGAM|nr:hypothetical protein F5148DRAFT_981447 [Russula earlei]
MGRGIIYFIFQRPRFCCCLPVRICVVIMSLLGILVSGILSVVLWFEVSRAYPFPFLLDILNGWVFLGAEALTSKELRSFIGGAIVETLLFIISVVGLIGAIVRKLTFMTAYAIGLYIHFLINLIVAGYLLFVILHTTQTDTAALCQHALKNAQAQNQCASLFGAIRGVYAALATLVLVVELYGAIVATRYAYQLRREKREARMPRRTHPESDSGRLIPGFVRYKEESGAAVYDSYYHLPTKGHSRGASAYSLAGSEYEGVTPFGLYDPHGARLLDTKYHEDLDFEDDNKQDDAKDQDHGDNHLSEPPPGLETSRKTVEVGLRDAPDSPR